MRGRKRKNDGYKGEVRTSFSQRKADSKLSKRKDLRGFQAQGGWSKKGVWGKKKLFLKDKTGGSPPAPMFDQEVINERGRK